MSEYVTVSYNRIEDEKACIRIGPCKQYIGIVEIERLINDLAEIRDSMQGKRLNFIDMTLKEIANPAEVSETQREYGVVRVYVIDDKRVQKCESIYINGTFIDTENLGTITVTSDQLVFFDSQSNLIAETFLDSIEYGSLKLIPFHI